MAALDPRQHYGEGFQRFARGPGAAAPGWLMALRKDAFARFAELGFPSTRQEEWRYTSVAPIAECAFELASDGVSELSRDQVEHSSFPVYACSLFVFVNGNFAPRLSAPRALSGSPHVESLAGVLEQAPGRLEPRLARLASYEAAPFVALNTAFLHDGALVEVPDGVTVEAPIHLVYLSLPERSPRVSYPRTLLSMGRGSHATVIEDYVSLGAGHGFTNAVSEVRLDSGARLDLVRLQREGGHHFHVSDVHVELARDSRFTAHDFSLGGALVRKDVSANLAGEGAECTLDGLYLASGRELVDNHTLIDHASANGTSRELYKGILSGAGRGVFHGRIVVREGARKTDARQTNKNLLLSRDAEVDSKPQLEIGADDVKCSHGSTIGQLDEASLFYLQTRGIDAPSARRLLMRAFASEVTSRIRQEPLRDEIEEILLGRIAHEEVGAP
jgi:Fe-S cluster assembly protein SufD